MRWFGGAVGVLLFFLVGVGGAWAASADPNPLAFGDVPINTSVTRSVTVTLDAGYHVIGATGAGINAPFSLDFDTCATVVGPGTCTVKETFAPTVAGAAGGSLGLFVCPASGGSCLPDLEVGLSGNGTQIPTATTLTSSANPSRVGAAVTFTATVTPTAGGSITFAEGASTLATVALSGGTATFTTSSLAIGSHTITASYGGDATHGGSSATLNQVVRLATTSTTLASSANPSLVGQIVTFTATVSAESGSGAAAGTVTFSDGSATLATVALGTGGTATFTTSSLATGSHTITASYGGDVTHSGSSATLTQVVQDAATLLAVLRTDVSAVGPGSSLSSKVATALSDLAAGDTADACRDMSAFLNEVNAQRGKVLTAAQAAQFTAEAQRIMQALGCTG